MSDGVKEAIRLLGVYTARRFDVYALAGPAKASCRAHIMSAIRGRRCTQRESGITVIRDALFAQCGIAGGCLAEREDNFREFCLGLSAVN